MLNNDLEMSDLKTLLTEDETNGLEYENLSSDGTNNCLLFKASKNRIEKFLLNLKEFLENEKFCDVILKTESSSQPNTYHSIKAHKIILAAASPYFKAMFAGGKQNLEQKMFY